MRFGNWYEMVVIYFWVVAVFFSLLSLVYFLFTALLVFLLLLLLLLLHLLSSRVNSFFSSAWYAGKKLEVGSVYVVRERAAMKSLYKKFFFLLFTGTRIFSHSLLLYYYLTISFFFSFSLSLAFCLFVCLFVGLFFFFFSSPLENLFSLHIYTLYFVYIQYIILYYIGGLLFFISFIWKGILLHYLIV